MNTIKDKIQTVNIQDIKPYEQNAKIHDDAQIDKIAKSIRENGYIQPISVDENNVIVAGHGRYEALKKDDPNQEIDVIRITNLSPDKIRKLRILDNKLISEEWDTDILQREIDNIYGGLDNIDLIAEELNVNMAEIMGDMDQAINEKEIDENIETTHECPKCGYVY